MVTRQLSELGELQSILANPPDVWGEGGLFASSGMDGATVTASGAVASLWSPAFDLLLHLQQPHRLRLRASRGAVARVVTGDTLAVRTVEGALVVVWAAWHTLVGEVPPDVQVQLAPDDRAPVTGWGLAYGKLPHQHVALARTVGGRFAVGFGTSEGEAQIRAQAGLRHDPWQVAAQRMRALRDLRARADDRFTGGTSLVAPWTTGQERLLNKCLSVMRVNSLSAEGAIRQAWSTPDRVPHRHMWLWDTAFHSLAMSALDPEMAWQHLKSVLDFGQPDGRISITVRVDGALASDLTQPPVLAWAVWHNYQAHRRRDRLVAALPTLEAYLAWNLRHRDPNGSGLLAWVIETNPLSRCGESGMDNSPRFDAATPLEAVDFNVFQAHDMHHVGLIARELGEATRAETWFGRAEALSRRIHERLWDADRGFYVDRYPEGELSDVEAVSGFLPLLLNDCPADSVVALAAALVDPRRFGTTAPVPSVSRSHPTFSCDMWRGPMWLNYNYLVILGLRKHGQDELAGMLAARTVAAVQRYYERDGVIYEFYDALDERPPSACDRKGQRREGYLSRPYGDAIRDYHWTAALTACLLLGP
jgi:hypothetical protein